MKTSKKTERKKSRFLVLISTVFKRIAIAVGLLIKYIALLPVRLLMLLLNKLGNLFRFSLTFKISLIYTMLVLVVLIVFNASLISFFKYFMVDTETSALVQTRIRVLNIVHEDELIDADHLSVVASEDNVIINVLDENTENVYSTDSLLKPVKYNLTSNIPVLLKINEERYLVASAKTKVGDTYYYIQLIKDVGSLYENVYSLIVIGVILTIIFILAIAAIGSRISKNLLDPITTMTGQVKAISIKNLDRRLDVTDAKDELKDLAMQFNSMLDHIEDAYGKQNQFVSDASHELRTPISVINGYVGMLDRWGKRDEAILDESIQAIKGETIQMKELIEKLLFLARSDRNKIEMEIERVDLNELMEEICRETRMIDSKHDIVCDVEGESMIYGNNKLIKQMIRIFIENAIKFTEESKQITLMMRVVGDRTMLAVKDAGIGIPKEDIAKIFDRFYRADKSRTKSSGGSGLGLSIAKWIIDQHGAEVKVFSELNVGTKVEIWFNERVSLVDEEEVNSLDLDRE
ncbi:MULTISPECIES: cell wall metabolism sensor histidine kinase WalK [unclassified Fusibacter]|uniref:sensor histidine kinase n=1 Tax=unclassified Fusibacter TaxID=2624464 RepID=UPI00101062D1|nr:MULTISPECIES: ATP-binding protein [unclassified Fusibacter]MCK8059206.1 ATP-binding protein [Fusibacter sp. A2]NPE21332.1 HAMP domain-containing protein [Fusibacter sp. A1]RXV62593.1 HAMP domain-containing protein [Fusibacter sp. A1]